MTVTLDAELRDVLGGSPIAHLATVLPDGAPHSVPLWVGVHDDHVVFMTGPESRKARNLQRDPRVALSLTPPDQPFQPVMLRGAVTEWLDGERGWAVVDELAHKYLGTPYGRDQERVVGMIELDYAQVGM